jgi:chromosome segregation ATPase
MNIVTPTRYLVREDSLNMMIRDGKKSRKIFLFNDLLIVARKDWRDKYHLVEQANLRQCRVCDVTEDGDQALFEIEILPAGSSATTPSPSGQHSKRYLLAAPTQQVKIAWLEAYRGVAMGPIKKKKFSESSSLDVDVEEEKSDDEEDYRQKKDSEEKERIETEKKAAEEERIKQEKLQRDEEEKKKLEELQRRKELEDKIAQSEANLEEAVRRSETAEAKVRSFEQLVRSFEKEKEEAHVRIGSLEASGTVANERIKLLENQVKDIVRDRDSQADAARSLSKENSKLSNELHALKLEIDRLELRKSSMLAEKDLEMERAKRDLIDLHERDKIDWKAEKSTLISDRNSEKAALNSEITKLSIEINRLRDEAEARLKQAHEESDARIQILKQEAEVKMIKAEQEFEIRFLKAQEESRAKVHALENTASTLQQSLKSDIDQRDAALKNLELERINEKQRLSGEMEILKEKAQTIQENLKRSLTEVQSQLKDAQQLIKEREYSLRQKEDHLRDKEAVATRLEVEKQALNSEISRLISQSEGAKHEYLRSVSNMEKTIQERHQVLSRKESEIADLAHRLAQQTERATHALSDLEKLKLESNERQRSAEEKLGKLRDEITLLKAERAREHEQLQSLERSHKDTLTQLDQTKAQLQNITDANRRFAADHAKIKDSMVKQNEAAEKIAKENSHLQALLAELNEKLQRKSQEFGQRLITEQGLKDSNERLKDEGHKAILRAERAEARSSELERQNNRLIKEYEEEISAKSSEIHELKESLKKDQDAGKGRLSQELAELKQRLTAEFSSKEAGLLKENSELKARLGRELSELRSNRDHEEEVLKSRLGLVERLEKENNATKERLERENTSIREKLEILEVEYREKAKTSSTFRKRVRQLELENNTLMDKLQELSLNYNKLEEAHNELILASKSLEDEASLLRSRAIASEKEVSALAHRIGMYNELDKKYLELRDETAQITREAKTYEGELRKSESVEGKLMKEISVYKLVLDEIERSIVNAKPSTSSTIAEPRKSSLSSTLLHIERITSLSPVDEGRLVSIVTRLNDILLDHDRLVSELDIEKEKSKELDDFSKLLEQERVTTATTIKKFEQRLKEKTRDNQEEFVKLKTQIETLRAELDSSKAEKIKLENALVDSRTRAIALENEKTKLEQQFVELFERLQKQAEAQLKDSNTQTSLVASLKREIEILNAHLAELKRKSENDTLKIRELDIECNYLRQLTQSLTETKAKTQALLDSASSLSGSLKEDLQQTKTQLLASEQKIKELKAQRSADQEMLLAERERIRELEQDIDQLKAEANGELRKRGAEAATVISERESALEKMEELWHMSKKQIAQLEAKIIGMQKEIELLTEENSILEEESGRISQEETMLRSKLTMLQSNIVASDQRLRQMTAGEDIYASSRPMTATSFYDDNYSRNGSIARSPSPNSGRFKSRISKSEAISILLQKIHLMEQDILERLDISDRKIKRVIERSNLFQESANDSSHIFPDNPGSTALESLKFFETAASASHDMKSLEEAQFSIADACEKVIAIRAEIEIWWHNHILATAELHNKTAPTPSPLAQNPNPSPATRPPSKSSLSRRTVFEDRPASIPQSLSHEDSSPFTTFTSPRLHQKKLQFSTYLPSSGPLLYPTPKYTLSTRSVNDDSQQPTTKSKSSSILPSVTPDSSILFNADELLGIMGLKSL